ncbi:hypothetical protein JW935_25485 [candidate division KSB1 bacterium]|nr:hypothetical protein [candidate division KSB1 bacterium]
MKKYFLILVVLSSFLLSCEVSKDFIVKIDKVFNVNYAGETYETMEDIDAKEFSSDFEKYSSDLKSVEILKGTYEIIVFAGPATQKILSADLEVGSTEGEKPVGLAVVDDIVLAEALNNETSLTLRSAGKNKLADLMLNNPHTCRLYFSGQANEAPVVFSIKFRFECKVTYEKKLI